MIWLIKFLLSAETLLTWETVPPDLQPSSHEECLNRTEMSKEYLDQPSCRDTCLWWDRGVMDHVWEPCLWLGATKQIHMPCVCVWWKGCGIPAATSRVEFQLNEFICLANLTKAWIFSPCWLVLVRVRHWQQSTAGKNQAYTRSQARMGVG